MTKAVVPSISVVVMLKNNIRHMAESFDSIAASRVRPIEILVIDGGSTDGSREALAAWPEARLIDQGDIDLASAFNMGVALSRGELLAFCAADDVQLVARAGSAATRRRSVSSVPASRRPSARAGRK